MAAFVLIFLAACGASFLVGHLHGRAWHRRKIQFPLPRSKK